jgi:hypothetical protein
MYGIIRGDSIGTVFTDAPFDHRGPEFHMPRWFAVAGTRAIDRHIPCIRFQRQQLIRNRGNRRPETRSDAPNRRNSKLSFASSTLCFDSGQNL